MKHLQLLLKEKWPEKYWVRIKLNYQLLQVMLIFKKIWKSLETRVFIQLWKWSFQMAQIQLFLNLIYNMKKDSNSLSSLKKYLAKNHSKKCCNLTFKNTNLNLLQPKTLSLTLRASLRKTNQKKKVRKSWTKLTGKNGFTNQALLLSSKTLSLSSGMMMSSKVVLLVVMIAIFKVVLLVVVMIAIDYWLKYLRMM